MNIIVMDAETFYSDNFTLKKLTTEAYCRSPEFEVHGWGIRWSDGTSEWLTHAQATDRFKTIDWDNTAVLAHHSQFDLFLLNHTYGYRPKLILCTLSMARLVVGNHLSVALDSLAKHFGLAGKRIDYNSFRGKHWNELTPEEQKALADGCLWDVELTWQLFCKMMKGDY